MEWYNNLLDDIERCDIKDEEDLDKKLYKK